MPRFTACSVRPIAIGPLRRILAARAWASSIRPSGSTTRLTKPIARARLASIGSPVNSISNARPLPTMRGSRWVPPKPGTMPSLSSGWPSRALDEATRRWQAMASSSPPPKA